MSPPPLPLLTDTQADIPGSPFFTSPYYLLSPQPSPISPLIVHSPGVDADFFWREAFYDAIVFPSKLDLGEIPPYFLEGDVVEHHAVSAIAVSDGSEHLLTPAAGSHITPTLLRRLTSVHRTTLQEANLTVEALPPSRLRQQSLGQPAFADAAATPASRRGRIVALRVTC